MVLVTHQLQGSKVAYPFRPLPWSKGLRLKQCVTTVHMVGRTDRCLSLKRNFSLSVGASRTRGLKVKHFKISAFKGTGQAGESGGRANNGSKVPKNSVNLSYAPKDNEENITKCQNTENVPLSCTSETNEIKNLFKKWLTMLRTQLPSQVVDNVLEEASACEKSEVFTETPSNEQSGILMVALRHFWSLDATIKIPLMIFIPWFLSVNVVYGAEVSKELAPLWIFGPLVVALYIKFFKGLCALYAFTFKQTAKIIKNLPSYYLVAYQYLAKGKLKEAMRTRIWQPIEDFKNMDYKEFSRRKLKVIQEWLMEKYIDFVESIWPYYCRTIRFLKRANLI